MADISLLPVVGKLDGLTTVQKINEALTSLNEANRLGIPAWSSTTSYGAGALTWDAGQTYKSTVANSGQRPSTTPASWVSWGLTLSDLQNGYETMAEATGTAGAYAANYWPAITGLSNGQELRFKVPADNIGGSTLAVNAIPAAPILSLSGATLQRGELVANGVARVRWSATRNAFILLNCEGAASSSGSGLPLLFPLWCPNRAAIPAGYAPADGQTLSRSLYPDAWAAIAAGNVPVQSDADWLASPYRRGKFTTGDGTSTFRLPDYNGKSSGAVGAVFLRGDGALSTGEDGLLQQDAIRNITGQIGLDSSFGMSTGSNSTLTGAFKLGSVASGRPTGAASSDSRWVEFDASKAVPTATDNRPLNVTGCWVIRLFGAVVNPGAADAAQLATEVSKLGADKVPFTAFLGANQSMATSGYQKLPGGLILQWYRVSMASGGAAQTFSHPIAFPNFVFVATNAQSAVAASTGAAVVNSLTTTQITLTNNSGSTGANTTYVIAIGY